jgi:hypothetical protein
MPSCVHRLVLRFGKFAVALGVFMENENDFYRQQAQRARDLAERADPFTSKRLLALAKKYIAKAGTTCRPSSSIKRPLSLTNAVAPPSHGRSGEV